MASEIADNQRFPRRTLASEPEPDNNTVCSFLPAPASSNPLLNHSTIKMNTAIFPSANFIAVTSGGPALLSTTTSSSSCIDTISTSKPHPPPVCGFSGLPLFPPTDRNRNSVVATTASDSVIISQISNSMDDTSATVWIDGVIRDLIHTSSNVSISEIIHNVREIIYPCNPNLATLLEYRLRSLEDPVERRSKEGEASLLQRNHSPQQGSSGLTFNLDPALDSLPSCSLPESCSMSQYLNWEINPLAVSNSAVATQHQHHNQISSTPSATTPSVLSLCQTPPHHQQTRVQQPLPVPEENPSPVEKTTSSTTACTTPTSTFQLVQACSTRDRKEEIRQQKRDEEGLHLLSLLLQCAEAVSANKFEEANRMLLELSQLSTPFGTSAQRVAAYFSEAMSARLLSSCLGICATLPLIPQSQSHTQKIVSAFQVFNGISPFVKFSHFTANQAIQEAFEREERVHIIDLDIMQGLQWPGLFHILASRPGGPPHVRLTGLGTSLEALEATGKRLSDFADKLGLPFQFCPVADKVGYLEPERLKVSKTEAVAVHWLQHSLYDVTGSDTNTLWLLRR